MWGDTTGQSFEHRGDVIGRRLAAFHEKPAFQALSEQDKVSANAAFYQKHIAPAYAKAGLKPPELKQWLRDSVSDKGLYEVAKQTINAATKGPREIALAGTTIAYQAFKQAYGAAEYWKIGTEKSTNMEEHQKVMDEVWAKASARADASIAAKARNSVEDSIKSQDFWFRTHPRNTFLGAAGHWTGEQMGQLPLWAGLFEAKIGSAVVGGVGEALAPRLAKSAMGRMAGNRLNSGFAGFFGNMITSNFKASTDENITSGLQFMMFDTMLEMAGGWLNNLKYLAFNKNIPKPPTPPPGEPPFATTISSTPNGPMPQSGGGGITASELEHKLLGTGQAAPEATAGGDPTGPSSGGGAPPAPTTPNTPAAPAPATPAPTIPKGPINTASDSAIKKWSAQHHVMGGSPMVQENINNAFTLLVYLKHAATATVHQDPVIARMITGEQMALQSLSMRHFGAPIQALPAELQQKVLQRRLELMREAEFEAPAHVPDLAYKENFDNLSAWLKLAIPEAKDAIDNLQKRGVDVAKVVTDNQLAVIKSQTGMTSPQAVNSMVSRTSARPAPPAPEREPPHPVPDTESNEYKLNLYATQHKNNLSFAFDELQKHVGDRGIALSTAKQIGDLIVNSSLNHGQNKGNYLQAVKTVTDLLHNLDDPDNFVKFHEASIDIKNEELKKSDPHHQTWFHENNVRDAMHGLQDALGQVIPPNTVQSILKNAMKHLAWMGVKNTSYAEYLKNSIGHVQTILNKGPEAWAEATGHVVGNKKPKGTIEINTKTDEFDHWFKGSVVKDSAGKPMVMYHRTDKKFLDFDIEKVELGVHFAIVPHQVTIHSEDPGARTIPAYLSIKNPLRTKDLGTFNTENVVNYMISNKIITQEAGDKIKADSVGQEHKDKYNDKVLRDALFDLGYDGIVYVNRFEGIKGPDGNPVKPTGHKPSSYPTSDADFLKMYPDTKDAYIAFAQEQIQPKLISKLKGKPGEAKAEATVVTKPKATKAPTVDHREKDFQTVANTAANKLEFASQAVTKTQGVGVYANVAQRMVDLLYRMTSDFSSKQGEYDLVKADVDKMLKTLTDAEGFRKKHHADLNNNLEKKMAMDTFYDEFEHQDKVDKAKRQYAEAFDELKVHNNVQGLAKRAATFLGLENYQKAIANLKVLQKIIDKGPENWVQEAGEHPANPRPVSKPNVTGAFGLTPGASAKISAADFGGYRKDTVAYMKNPSKGRLAADGKLVGKRSKLSWNEQLKKDNYEEFIEMLKDADGDHVKFENPIHRMLFHFANRKELEKPVEEKLIRMLKKKMPKRGVADFNKMADRLLVHMFSMAKVGRLTKDKNVFKSSKFIGAPTKWQFQLNQEVDIQELNMLYKTLALHPGAQQAMDAFHKILEHQNDRLLTLASDPEEWLKFNAVIDNLVAQVVK